MFDRNNLTDFERFLIAQAYVKELKTKLDKSNKRNEELQAKIAEQKKIIKSKYPNAGKLHKYKVRIKTLREECKNWKNKYERINNELVK